MFHSLRKWLISVLKPTEKMSQGDQASYLPFLSVVFGVSVFLSAFVYHTLKHACVYVCMHFFMVMPFGLQGVGTDPEERRDEAHLVTRLWLCVWPSC